MGVRGVEGAASDTSGGVPGAGVAGVSADDALRGEGVVNGGMSLCRLRFEGGLLVGGRSG